MTVGERLAALASYRVNFDVSAPQPEAEGWRHDEVCQPLGREAPGEPEPDGLFERAKILVRDYRAADPALVRAYYDETAPLEGRDMLLQLRFHGLFSVWAGCRVGAITDSLSEVGGRPVRKWGWPYMTLEGHVEQGQMDWEVWKWLDTGEVEFRIHAVSRATPEGNPIVRLGFRLIGQREREQYLRRARERMRELSAG